MIFNRLSRFLISLRVTCCVVDLLILHAIPSDRCTSDLLAIRKENLRMNDCTKRKTTFSVNSLTMLFFDGNELFHRCPSSLLPMSWECLFVLAQVKSLDGIAVLPSQFAVLAAARLIASPRSLATT
ncbi:hypothetical protein HRR83_001921 [Exophiala dermatitidis]|uniref:Secreted protein n=1 Tax=Exophiala dermatitidis TaxID=5970 RepID=A0AAN6EWA2_EXODE|nr:hypothetical protein HRR73_005457 [Exophiala dermatitidis]KAJ4523805.1 hypothetical protein HRR74_001998 [Exophiala dermatitidis]KAJ4537257.1 hypothetical protein HRR76_005270 [Exophiala dermatitidis]KAJ4555145.1 hypothetical protein HRR77_001086 [Exophiala dermatitidis]KAJ4566327.1 hypothetical protein HRR79_005336 [Exophiala dermatitidis]